MLIGDDAWFDDKEEAWFDDDYYSGDLNFDDDAVGFVKSVEPAKKPHHRHHGDHKLTHWFHKRKRHRGDDDDGFAGNVEFVKGLFSVVSVLVLGAFALFGCFLYARQIDNKPDADPCDPCFKMIGVGVATTLGEAASDDLAPMLGRKAARD